MASPFEIAAAAIGIVHIAAKILDVTTKFAVETKTVNDRRSDLVSQITLLRDVLPPVAQTLRRRQECIIERPVTPDEQSLLDAIAGVIDRLHTTVKLFEEKVEKLAGPPGRWRDAMLQLRLMKSESDIASLENRINSEMSSLHLMMTCYTWYDKLMQNESLPGYTEDDAMTYQVLARINGNMQSFRTELNRLTIQLGVDPTDAMVTQEPPPEEKGSPSEGWSDLKMMLNCFDAANSMIKNLSRNGTVVTREPRVDDDPSCYDHELQTDLILTCQYRAEQNLENRDYKSAENYLRRAIDEARKRQAHHGTPFKERYQFETMLAKAYLGLSKFDLATKTLEGLKPVAETSPLKRAELFYLLADLYRRQYYQDTKNQQRLAEWNSNAIVAYNLARKLSTTPDSLFEDNKLILGSAKLMIDAHRCKGDDIIPERVIRRHWGAGTTQRDSISTHDPEDGRRSSAKSCPTLPSTSLSPSPSRTDSVISEPVPPPPPADDHFIHQQSLELFNAISNEDMTTVKDLLARDPRLTWKTDDKGRTPLMLAITKRDITLAKLLIHRSPIHITDKDSKTVFHHAVFGYIHKDMVKAIIDHKDVTPSLLDALDNDGQTALHQCVIYQKFDAARHLIAHGASLDIRDGLGDTPAAVAEAENRRNFKELFQLANTLIEGGMFRRMSHDARYKYLCGNHQGARHSTSSTSTTSIHERRSSKGSDTRRESVRSSAPSTKSVRKLWSWNKS